MIAVLVDSRKEGKSGWVAVRHTLQIVVTGLTGGLVGIRFDQDEGEHSVLISEDGEFPLPSGTETVQAEILETTDDTKVFVDLE